MKEVFQKITNKQIFVMGLLAVLLSFIPYIILGIDSIVPYHDQLDVEFINYMYQAKYLFSGSDIVPEFLGGASKTAMTPPAPLAVLLFKVFAPFTAYMVLQFICQVTSYVGMYALARVITDKGVIALIVSLFFTYNPFLPVHGLAIYGSPMLVLCIMYLYQKKHICFSYVYVAFYAFLSSLVLCGFAWLGFWLVGLVLLGVYKRLKAHKQLMVGFFIMLGVYIAENASLLCQMFGLTKSVESHKAELVLNGGNIWDTFINYLKYNDQHTADNHLWILGLSVLIVVILWCFGGKICHKGTNYELRSFKVYRGVMTGILIFNLLVYFVASVWVSSFGVAFRIHLGTLKAFNFSRIFWVTPVLWYVQMTLCLHALCGFKKIWKIIGLAIIMPVILYTSFTTLKKSMIKPCVQEILLPQYDAVSFSDYYAVGVLEQVEQFIREKDGLEKDEYKVASLGIDPAAALYHGFYCVDGYSNNYALEYKHKFRKVIATELEKNEWIKSYFDTWGNRCYVFYAERPGIYMVEKGMASIENLELNTAALKNLDCDYILSAMFIENASEKNLNLLNSTGLQTETSYYEIFVYKVVD